MTIYEKIEEFINNNNRIELGKYLCNIQDNLASVDNEKLSPCDVCPAASYCSPGHNGWITLLTKSNSLIERG